MQVNYIVVQAGGKGTRMGQMTYNRPKALVPVENLPILFHLFRKFPEKKYLIIGDYKKDVLKSYLHTFANVSYEFIDAGGKEGTCAGLPQALDRVPEGEALMLIWSDLILPESYELPKEATNYVGLSGDFPCRWKYESGRFLEEGSTEYGVAGFFLFTGKDWLKGVPQEGEFVRWLQGQSISFAVQSLQRTKEYGILAEYQKLERQKCRPFNRMTDMGTYIIKEPVDRQGEELAEHEVAWYEKVRSYGFGNIPIIYGTHPLKMERINGKNIYEYQLDRTQKENILRGLIDCIRQIHRLESCPASKESYYEAYVGKTFRRLEKIRKLVPFAGKEKIYINGRECANIFYHKEEIKALVQRYIPETFNLLHGDCTFSNMMLRDDMIPVLIDPRGYFGFMQFYGDPVYDWVKVYYSLAGNYDQFNLKRFVLKIEETEVFLEISSNHWEDMEDTFFRLLEGEVTIQQIKLFHALIWLSLTTYTWEDYDSICGAFYKGLLVLLEVDGYGKKADADMENGI